MGKERLILRTENLTVGYHKGKVQKPVLENLNLQLEKGKMVCIIGPNGSGKSTLIRSLANLHKPISGNIYIHDKPVESYSKKGLSQNISVVLTEKVGKVNFTVKELIALGRYPYTDFTGKLRPKDHKRIEKAIFDTGLSEISDNMVSELSDGQFQKVMIARALAQEGDLIILDEPTAHLDLNNRVDIMILLREISKSSDKSVLVSSHDLSLAMETADFFWLTHNKQVISGTPEDMVVNGLLASVFHSPNYHFNIETGKFTIKKKTLKSVEIIGAGPYLFWTKHFLEKEGYASIKGASVIIEIYSVGENTEWHIISKSEKVSANSLHSLIEQLKCLSESI